MATVQQKELIIQGLSGYFFTYSGECVLSITDAPVAKSPLSECIVVILQR
jgi:hypothetical protein